MLELRRQAEVRRIRDEVVAEMGAKPKDVLDEKVLTPKTRRIVAAEARLLVQVVDYEAGSWQEVAEQLSSKKLQSNFLPRPYLLSRICCANAGPTMTRLSHVAKLRSFVKSLQSCNASWSEPPVPSFYHMCAHFYWYVAFSSLLGGCLLAVVP